jgi:acyl carrier protein
MASQANTLEVLTRLHRKLGQIGTPALLENKERPLSELGIDSLDRVELLFELEERFNLQIPDDVLHSIHTVGDLLKYLEAHGIRITPESSCA